MGMQIVDLPAALHRDFISRGQDATGATYAKVIQGYLDWLNTKGIKFETAPNGTIDGYLSEKGFKAATWNRNASALRAMQNFCTLQGIEHVHQTVTQQPQRRDQHLQLAPPPQEAGTAPSLPPMNIPAPPVPTIMSPPPTPPVATQAPQPTATLTTQHSNSAVPKVKREAQQGAFPSLGQRYKFYKVAGPGDTSVPPGTLITIGTYQKELIEADGSLSDFVLYRLRSIHGPHYGQPMAVYRVELLDAQGKAMPGASWDVPIAADISPPTHSVGPHAQAHQPVPMQQAQPVPPPAPQAAPMFPNSGSVIDKLLENEMKRSSEAQKRYDELLNEVRSKGGNIDPAMMMLLTQMRPAPLDPKEFAAKVKESLGDLTPPAAVVLPPMPAFEAPRSDGQFETLTRMVTDLQSKLLEMAKTPPAPAPAPVDPFVSLGQLMQIMKSMEKPIAPAEPIQTKLAEAMLKNALEPQKPKGLQEILMEQKTLQELFRSFAGEPEEKRSLIDGIVDMVGAVAENADKLGVLVERFTSGAMMAAFAGKKKKAEEEAAAKATATQATNAQNAAAAQAAAHAQQQKKQKINDESAAAFVAVLEASKTAKGDETDLVALTAVQKLFAALKADQPVYGQVVDRVLAGVLEANNKIDLSATVAQFYKWLGASKFTTAEHVNPVVDLIHRNYEILYSTLTNGQEKKLADAVALPQDPVPAAPVPAAEVAAPLPTPVSVVQPVATTTPPQPPVAVSIPPPPPSVAIPPPPVEITKFEPKAEAS